MSILCPKCGAKNESGDILCSSCGEVLPKIEHQEVQNEPKNQSENRYQSDNCAKTDNQKYYENIGISPQGGAAYSNIYKENEDNSTLSCGQFLLTIFLCSLPIVGWIMAFVWSFSNGVNQSKKNYCRAMLIWKGIGVILSTIAIMIFGTLAAVGFGISNILTEFENRKNNYEYYNDSYEDFFNEFKIDSPIEFTVQ